LTGKKEGKWKLDRNYWWVNDQLAREKAIAEREAKKQAEEEKKRIAEQSWYEYFASFVI